jgi:hypothetical protein
VPFRKLELSSEFVAYEPNTIVTFRFSGSVPGEGSCLFESTQEGTRVTSRVQMQPTGFSRLAEPLIAANLRRQMEAPVSTDFGWPPLHITAGLDGNLWFTQGGANVVGASR